MRRPRTAALALAGGLLLGAPALTACSEEPASEQVESTTTEDQDLEDEVEDLDDEGAVDGVDSDDQELENQVEDLDDEGVVDGVEETPS